MFARRSATLLPVDVAITSRAVDLMETLAPSHGLRLADALIAATAVEHRMAVLMANVRHFAVVTGLSVEPFAP
ncbi:MAG: PIN domain-containing protein [Burkholderiales bacterium]|jgi:hypothetical protein|nr:PIN domain-containing protein [Burkholderiales bacterium]